MMGNARLSACPRVSMRICVNGFAWLSGHALRTRSAAQVTARRKVGGDKGSAADWREVACVVVAVVGVEAVLKDLTPLRV